MRLLNNGLAALCVVVAMAASGLSASLRAQTTDTEKEIEKYRAMISDPMSNPAFLNVDRGEILMEDRARHQECQPGAV